jgi:hypothetical protein
MTRVMASADPLDDIRTLRSAIQADRQSNADQWRQVDVALAAIAEEEHRVVTRAEMRGSWLLTGALVLQSALVVGGLFVAVGSHELDRLPRAIAIGGGGFSVVVVGLLVALRGVFHELERALDWGPRLGKGRKRRRPEA